MVSKKNFLNDLIVELIGSLSIYQQSYPFFLSSAGNNGSGSNCGSLSRRSLSTLEHQRNTWQTRGGSGTHSDHQMMQLRPVSGGGSKAPPGVPLSEERPPLAVPIFGCLIMIGIYLLFGAAFVAR